MGREKNIQLRNDIVKLSYQLFVNEGYDRVTTREIAEKNNIGRALLHYYYSKKDDIGLSIVMSIQDCLNEFLQERLPLRYLEAGWGSCFFTVLFDCFQKRNLIPLYLQLQTDANMVWTMLSNSFFGINNQKKPEWFNQHMTGACLIMSSMSQLIQCESHGLISKDYREILYTSMRIYYFYMDYTKEEAERFIRNARVFVTPELVEEFIVYYEDKLGWKV